jgi:hypothetical protein
VLTLGLQKKPVIFLHWYHHAVTLMYCWIAWIRCIFPPIFMNPNLVQIDPADR